MPAVVARFEPPADDALQTAIDAFDCVTRRDGYEDPGEVTVREFLRNGAFANAAATGTTTTWLLADRDNAPHKVVGYVTLALTQIRLNRAEARDAELATAGRSAFGAVRIAMIGVDREFQHRGHGTLLINTVILHTARMSNEVSVRFIVADAASTQVDWYRHRGFVENNADEEQKRLAKSAEQTGLHATSMRLDLGPDPRILLDTPRP